MNIIKQILFVYYIGGSCISCSAQSNSHTYTETYDLNFTMKQDSPVVYNWRENAAYANYTFPILIKDSNRELFTRRYFKGFPFTDRLRTEYEQRILLPIHQEKTGSVVFESKGDNLKSVSILLEGINREEKVVHLDTLRFTPDSLLRSVTKKIRLDGVELLDIRICAEGEVDKDAYIVFSKLNVWIGDKAIDEFPIRQLPQLNLTNNMGHIPINPETGEGLEKIANISNKRIIGLGESIHGNNSMRKCINQLILKAVEKQGCRLVLWEMPLEKSLAYNRYIQDNDYRIDSLLSIDHQTKDFLNKLRSYNTNNTSGQNVKLFGMDYTAIYASDQHSAVDIFDFITPLNQQAQLPEVDRFAVLLMNQNWNDAIAFLETHRNSIQKILTSDEIDCILHILSLSESMGHDGIQRFINRDFVMFLNTKFLLDKFASSQHTKTFVYGHAAHINILSTFPAVPCDPFGSYMRKTYSEDYLPLLLLIDNGQTLAYDATYNRVNNSLGTPPDNSVESLLNSFDNTSFYWHLPPDFDQLTISRFKGSHHIPQEFFPFNLYRRYNGLLFIKGVHQEENKETLSFEESSHKFITKTKQRQQVLSEIQKRMKDEARGKSSSNR